MSAGGGGAVIIGFFTVGARTRLDSHPESCGHVIICNHDILLVNDGSMDSLLQSINQDVWAACSHLRRMILGRSVELWTTTALTVHIPTSPHLVSNSGR